MRNIFTKFSLSYLLVITLLTGLIVYFSYDTIRDHYLEETTEDLKKYLNILDTEFQNIDIEEDTKSVQSILKNFSDNANIRITIIDTLGVVLYDTEEDPATMDNHLNRPEIKESIKNKYGKSNRYSNTVEDNMQYVAAKIENIGDNYFLRVSFFTKKMNILISEVRGEIIEIAVFVYLLSILALLFFFRNISRPIKELSLASQKVAEGNFDIKVKIKTKDEFSRLADNFNNMTKRLKILFHKVNSQKEELDTLISGMQDGLVVLDSKGRVLLYNEAFSNTIGFKNIVGKKFQKIIENEALKDIIENTRAKGKSFTSEIEIDEKTIICSSSWIKLKEEMILLLRDITELKKLELIKKDFVLNVSHELRTPLTAIKGFSETLVDELEEESNKRYAVIIKRHADRLINIVNDLLTLSEIQDSKTNLILKPVKVDEFIDNVFNLFTQKAAEKGLDYEKEIKNSGDIISIDVFKMEQALVNLIDNAIKYTDTGKVKIISQKVDNEQVFIVQDTGLGIPQEDKDRIFERFYTVDKSRSRRLGGTGLGLSIVKHIVLLHKGKLRIESTPKEGSKFYITIPLGS